MIVMGTITNTPRSAYLSGYSIHNAVSTSMSSSTEPRNKFVYIAGVTRTSNTLAGPHDSQIPPPARPGKASRRSASRSTPETENSAARCRVFLGHKLKLFNIKQLSKAQSQPENTQVGNSVNFQYSAMKPTACVSSSATRITRSTLLSNHVYRMSASVRAIDKKGSYVYYLARRIKLFKSKMASYADDLVREFNLASSKIDSYTQDLNMEMNLMNAKIAPYTHDVKRKINLLNSRVDSYFNDTHAISAWLHSKVCSYVDQVSRNRRQLISKIGPFAQDVDRQMKLIESIEALHREHFLRKLDLICSKVKPFMQLNREIKSLLINKLAEF